MSNSSSSKPIGSSAIENFNSLSKKRDVLADFFPMGEDRFSSSDLTSFNPQPLTSGGGALLPKEGQEQEEDDDTSSDFTESTTSSSSSEEEGPLLPSTTARANFPQKTPCPNLMKKFFLGRCESLLEQLDELNRRKDALLSREIRLKESEIKFQNALSRHQVYLLTHPHVCPSSPGKKKKLPSPISWQLLHQLTSHLKSTVFAQFLFLDPIEVVKSSEEDDYYRVILSQRGAPIFDLSLRKNSSSL